MAPKSGALVTGVLFETENESHLEEIGSELEERTLSFSLKDTIQNLRNLDWSKVVWFNLSLFVVLHGLSLDGIYRIATMQVMWQTVVTGLLFYFISALGITMCAHRLYAHRSYKASVPLRVVLLLFNTIAFQNDVYEWARDHRVHHKYSETDADPHNAKRGFFFSHMGWLMYRKHPDVIAKGKKLDLSDLEADPLVMFQRKYYFPYLVIPACFILPTLLPALCFGESYWNAYVVCAMLRYCLTLHITWFVNSLAHWVGNKPYDKAIYPSQNFVVAFFAFGEGWHNYHHVFPWDYRTAEFKFFNINVTTNVLDILAFFGLAWDLKTVTPDMVKRRVKRTGDGTHEFIDHKSD